MPQYHNYDENKVEITIKPLPYWRKIIRLPYFVGDRVRFKLKIVNKNAFSQQKYWYVFESFGSQEKDLMSAKKGETIVEGNVINSEGDVSYSIGDFHEKKRRNTVFTARVINRDTIFFQAVWFIIGATVTLASVILAWILGYIQIIW